MEPFLQDPPRRTNRLRSDRALRDNLRRILGSEIYEEVHPQLDEIAGRAAEEFPPLALQAETNHPRLEQYDAWGRRVDRLIVDSSWLELVRIGQEIGVVATAYEGRFGALSRVVQAGLLQLYIATTATADCPLAMTDAAARVLLNEDPQLASQYVPKLTARTDAWTSGQWMTEKEGGSDVGRTSTTARKLDEGSFALYGTKWFTSATTADVALALARPEGADPGSGGLSLFLLELRRPDGSWNGITVRRLKDKLGTRALPTSELELDGTVAFPVGGLGRGVAKVAPMLNITRVHSAMGGSAAVGQALMLAKDYAFRREAFGKPLAELPLHRWWIARVAADYEASLVLCLRSAELLGRFEEGQDQDIARVVFPLTKMAAARQGVWGCSELIESFGGAGYVEDTGIPRYLRDAHVQCIWEGTTSVMALDVLRALSRPGVAEAFFNDLDETCSRAQRSETEEVVGKIRIASKSIRNLLDSPTEQGARRLAWGMARTYEAALLAQSAAWTLDESGDRRALTAARIFTEKSLVDDEADVEPEDLGSLAFD